MKKLFSKTLKVIVDSITDYHTVELKMGDTLNISNKGEKLPQFCIKYEDRDQIRVTLNPHKISK